jgi:hypothetical protein
MGSANLKARIGTSIAFSAIFCAVATGRAIYVDDDGPADFNNIQAAINDANDGDKIVVQSGSYTECVRFHGKNITLTSTNPGDFNTVAATVIEYGAGFVGTEDPNCTLIGFKINGWISGVDYLIDPTGENHTHATISHCLFAGNPLSNGTVMQACDGTISNCVIADNRPSGDLIAPAIRECHGLIKNCTVAHNTSGIWVRAGGTTTIENCIIYHGGGVSLDNGATVKIRYSDIQGGLEGIYRRKDRTVNWGPGNIDTDPCFVRVGDWFGELNGDYHLKSQAGRWDPNSQTWVQDKLTSPCIDAGDPISPVGLEPFPNGGRINMGAYGGTAEASKSYFGKPVCETIIAGDINGDCQVNIADFAIMAMHWLEDNTPRRVVTTTYEFLTDKSSIIAYCGRGGIRTYSIQGTFRLTVNFDACKARFEKVDATLSKEIRFVDDYPPAKEITTESLDVLFHMTELISTDVNDTSLSFVFYKKIPTFPGADVHLRVVLQDNSARLTGTFGDAVYDGCWYDLNALAVAVPDGP